MVDGGEPGCRYPADRGAIHVAGCTGGEGIRPSDSALVDDIFHHILHYVGRQYGL
jgi:hypothetical protein